MKRSLQLRCSAIDGLYRIEGGTFTFTARDTGGITAALGYFTDKLV